MEFELLEQTSTIRRSMLVPQVKALLSRLGSGRSPCADSDDPAQGYRHDHAHRSDLIPRGIPI